MSDPASLMVTRNPPLKPGPISLLHSYPMLLIKQNICSPFPYSMPWLCSPLNPEHPCAIYVFLYLLILLALSSPTSSLKPFLIPLSGCDCSLL